MQALESGRSYIASARRPIVTNSPDNPKFFKNRIKRESVIYAGESRAPLRRSRLDEKLNPTKSLGNIVLPVPYKDKSMK